MLTRDNCGLYKKVSPTSIGNYEGEFMKCWIKWDLMLFCFFFWSLNNAKLQKFQSLENHFFPQKSFFLPISFFFSVVLLLIWWCKIPLYRLEWYIKKHIPCCIKELINYRIYEYKKIPHFLIGGGDS